MSSLANETHLLTAKCLVCSSRRLVKKILGSRNIFGTILGSRVEMGWELLGYEQGSNYTSLSPLAQQCVLHAKSRHPQTTTLHCESFFTVYTGVKNSITQQEL